MLQHLQPAMMDYPWKPSLLDRETMVKEFGQEFVESMQQKTFVQRFERLSAILCFNIEKLNALKEKFRGQKSLEEIFSGIWDLKEAHDIMSPQIGPYGKSDILADLLRNEGNKHYIGKQYGRALERYNFSIMVAPHPVLQVAVPLDNKFPHVKPLKYSKNLEKESISLAKGYANRSAIMLEFHCFEKCLRDIDLAFKYGYPKELQSKLEARKQRCISAKNDEDVPVEDLSIAEKKYAFEGGLYNQGATTLKKILNAPAKTMPKFESNPSIPSCSSSVKVNYTPSKGRGLVATCNISTGEVIAAENGYCVSIERAKVSTYCSYCVRLTIDPLPCPGCGVAIFCGDPCRTRALTEDHWIECKLLPTLVALDMVTSNLSVKMFKAFSYPQMNDMLTQWKKGKPQPPKDLGCSTEGVYSSDSYRSIHHLCTHQDKFSFEELFKFCQLSFIITKLLHQSERYFVDDHGEPFTPSQKDLVATGAVVMSHMLKRELNVRKLIDKRQEIENIGNGMFSAVSLINHSCNPSAVQYNYGRMAIVRATRPISAGEEISVGYGVTFHSHEQPARKKHLKQFHFSCSCIACESHWPISVLLPRAVYRCVKCKAALNNENHNCRKCRVNYTNFKYRGNKKVLVDEWKYAVMVVEIALEKGDRLLNSIEKDGFDAEDELMFLCRAVDSVYEHTAMPCQAISDMENIVAQCLHAST